MLGQIKTMEDIAKLYPRLMYDLTTEKGRAMADAFAGFDIEAERAKLFENLHDKAPELPEWYIEMRNKPV